MLFGFTNPQSNPSIALPNSSVPSFLTASSPFFYLNDRTNELRMRFQIGHTPETQRMRFPLPAKSIVGQVALTRQPVLVQRRHQGQDTIPANPNVCSNLPFRSSRKTA